MQFNDFKRAIEDWARPDHRASVLVTQDGAEHAAITVMPGGKVVGAPSQSFRTSFADATALSDAEERIRGLIDEFYD